LFDDSAGLNEDGTLVHDDDVADNFDNNDADSASDNDGGDSDNVIDPDDAKLDVNNIDVESEDMCTVAGSDKWGPFNMSAVTRAVLNRSGNPVIAYQLVCSCPWHRDCGDPAATRCTRTVAYDSGREGSRAMVVRQLKAWALAGRDKKHRANKDDCEHSHKFVENLSADQLPDDATLNQQLRSAMQRPSWFTYDASKADDNDSDDSEVQGTVS
jgi:hypothetical protein